MLTPFLCRFKCKQSISASVGGNFHFINKVLTTPRLRRLPLESLVTTLFILKISASCNVFFHIFDQAAFFNERQNVEEKNKQCILTDVFKIYTKLCLCQELTRLRWNREIAIKDCWVLFLTQDVFKEVPVSHSHFSM